MMNGRPMARCANEFVRGLRMILSLIAAIGQEVMSLSRILVVVDATRQTPHKEIVDHLAAIKGCSCRLLRN